MMIPCVSCNSMFKLDNIHIKTTGSKVRCSKCHDVFMVYPPENYTGSETDVAVVIPKVQKSLLDDLFQVKNKPSEKVAARTIENSADYLIDSFEQMDDLEQVEEGEDTEYANLPDLSEYEAMIDWDEGRDSEDIALNNDSKYNGTQEL